MERIALTRQRIHSICSGIQHVIVPDRTYNLMTQEYVQSIYPLFRRWMFDFRQTDSWTEQFDCENFSELFKNFVYMIHAHYSFHEQKTQGQGVAFGVIHYTQYRAYNISYAHACNALLIPGIISDTFTFQYFESQTGQWIQLSDKEQQSIWFIGF